LSWLFWSDFDTNPFGAKAIYVVFRLWGWEVAANYSPRPKTHTNTQPTNQPTNQATQDVRSECENSFSAKGRKRIWD